MLGLLTTVASVRIVVKSFIQDIGANPGQAPENANPTAWLTLWEGTHVNFVENPATDERDGRYRLYSERTFTVTCCDRVVTRITPVSPVNTAVGRELNTFTPDPMLVSGVIEPSVATPAIGWFGRGKPHGIPELGFQQVKNRTSKFIWHSIGGLISCDSANDPTATIVMTGSRFPSHRAWVNGVQQSHLEQGPFNSLWIPDPNDQNNVISR